MLAITTTTTLAGRLEKFIFMFQKPLYEELLFFYQKYLIMSRGDI